MTFDDLIKLTREYLGDVSGSADVGRITEVINHSYCNLVLLAGSFDPTIGTRSKLLSWMQAFASSGWAIEMEIPSDFRRITAFLYSDRFEQADGSKVARSVAVEVVPLNEWSRIAGDSGEEKDYRALAYIRHSKPGVTAVSTVKRIGVAATQIPVTAETYAVGVHIRNPINTGVGAAWRLLYQRKPVDMQNGDDVPFLPEEHHEVIAVGAALRLAAMTSDPIIETLAETFNNKLNLMKETMPMRRGELVA